MLGLLNVHKPTGVTSRHVVDQVQRQVRPLKAGHAGTLDPLASGVLVVAIGKATRLMKYVQQMPKVYRGVFLLGQESDTEDVLGEIRVLPSASVPTREAVQSCLPQFLGEIQQEPPAYSAVKVKGERAYARARKGESFSLAARPVQIHELQLEAYEFTRMELSITCGSGTYIRSLGRDLARALGTGAVMESLVRCAIGSFTLSEAVLPETLDGEGWEAHVLPAKRAVESLPRVVL